MSRRKSPKSRIRLYNLFTVLGLPYFVFDLKIFERQGLK